LPRARINMINLPTYKHSLPGSHVGPEMQERFLPGRIIYIIMMKRFIFLRVALQDLYLRFLVAGLALQIVRVRSLFLRVALYPCCLYRYLAEENGYASRIRF